MRKAAVALTACLGAGLAASAADAPPRVDLGMAVVLAGESANLSVTLDGRGRRIAALAGDVVFPSALAFVQASAASSGLAAGAAVETTIGPGPRPASTKLVVKVTAAQGRFIPDGQVAVLTFTAPKDLGKEQSVDFTLTSRSVLTIGARETVRAEGADGLITVMTQPPSVAACFFFMH